MPKNPFVTIPAGPEWAQRAWWAAYLRNQQLEAERPDWRALAAVGVSRGLTHGIDGFFEGRAEGRKADNVFSLENLQQSYANDRQQTQLDAYFERQAAEEEAKRQAEFRKMLTLGAARKFMYGATQPVSMPQPDAVSHSTFGGEALFPQGGANPFAAAEPEPVPPSPMQGLFEDDIPTPMPTEPPSLPADDLSSYVGGATSVAPQPNRLVPGMKPSAVIAAMSPMAIGAMPHEELSTFLKSEQEKQPSAADLKTYKELILSLRRSGHHAEADAMALRVGLPAGLRPEPETAEEKAKRQAAEFQVQGTTSGVSSLTPEQATVGGYKDLIKPKPEEKPPNLTEGFMNWLVGPAGLRSVPEYMALPQADKKRIYEEYREFERKQQAGVAADVEASKLAVKQPAPQEAGVSFDRHKTAESALAQIFTLSKRVDLPKIAGGLAPLFNTISTTGQFNGIPIPESLRATLSNDEMKFLAALDNYADLVLRQRSFGSTTEGEMRRMFGFLATPGKTPQALLQSLGLQQDTLDTSRRILEEKFNQNRWIIPEDTTFLKARKLLRSKGLAFDDSAVTIFLQDNPGYK